MHEVQARREYVVLFRGCGASDVEGFPLEEAVLQPYVIHDRDAPRGRFFYFGAYETTLEENARLVSCVRVPWAGERYVKLTWLR